MKKISILMVIISLLFMSSLTSCRARKYVPTTEEPVPETRRIYEETDTETETDMQTVFVSETQ